MKFGAEQSDARLAYEAYREAAGGLTSDGRPMPTWDELAQLPHGARTRSLWAAAAAAIAAAVESRRSPTAEQVTALVQAWRGRAAADREQSTAARSGARGYHDGSADSYLTCANELERLAARPPRTG